MRPLIGALDALMPVLRSAFTALLVIAAVLAAIAWSARTRRLSPFGALARFSRTTLDPLLAPVERRAIRFGSSSAHAPWWAVLALLMISVGVLFLLEFVRNILVGAYLATERGPGGLLVLAISWSVGTLQLALLVRVITSWIGGTHGSIGYLAMRLTEWLLVPLRRVLPHIGIFDLSPLIAWFLLDLAKGALLAFM